MGRGLGLLWMGLVGAGGFGGVGAVSARPFASNPLPPPPGFVPTRPQLSPSLPLAEWQLRLAEADKLLGLGHTERARLILAEAEKEGAPRREALARWVTLAQAEGDQAEAARLCREGLADQPRQPRYLRELARALMALGDRPEARATVDSFLTVSPDLVSGALIAVDLWQRAGRPDEALALIERMRDRPGAPRLLGRQRAASLLALDRVDEGADVLLEEARADPTNLLLLRADLLEMAPQADRSRRLARALRARGAGGVETGTDAALLAASLDLRRGDGATAVATVEPLLAAPGPAARLLQVCPTLLREAPLATEVAVRAAYAEFLLAVLERLGAPGVLGPGLRPRALDLLAQAAEDALQGGQWPNGPEAAARRLERVLELVREGSPGSAHLYTAQILLARHTREVMRQPAVAAARLERLLTDLDLPLEGVALARLALGECYLAAGDTARGRLVLTALARTPHAQQRAAAGSAHWALARLDLAEGHYETARDRLAALALENPLADNANDALDLGLTVAEQLEKPAGERGALGFYGRSVLFQITAQPDSQRAVLERFVAAVPAMADPAQPQHLLERARLDLARLDRDAGRYAAAIAQCERLVLDHPDGRYPADALALEGDVRLAAGDPVGARAAWERLLTQYPSYLFADDVRDQIRSLP